MKNTSIYSIYKNALPNLTGSDSGKLVSLQWGWLMKMLTGTVKIIAGPNSLQVKDQNVNFILEFGTIS